MLKSPRRKLSKKNRNILSGLLVALASVYTVAAYLDLTREELFGFLLQTLLFVVGTIVLAVLTVLLFKGLAKIRQLVKKKNHS
ncbi:MAG: hypothetical protein RQ899_10955 [Pseudomonadales bacterium]|nr:hypothetical protein [Pseudomonadales bacterium]